MDYKRNSNVLILKGNRRAGWMSGGPACYAGGMGEHPLAAFARAEKELEGVLDPCNGCAGCGGAGWVTDAGFRACPKCRA